MDNRRRIQLSERFKSSEKGASLWAALVGAERAHLEANREAVIAGKAFRAFAVEIEAVEEALEKAGKAAQVEKAAREAWEAAKVAFISS